MKKEAQRPWLRGLQRLGCFSVLCALAITVGCGGGGGGADLDAGKSDDEKAIVNNVSSLSDIAGRLEPLRERFTAAAAPSTADAKKFEDNKVRIISDITITGTTATFDVEITSYAESPTTVEKTWKAVKEGDKWKLSEAPMP